MTIVICDFFEISGSSLLEIKDKDLRELGMDDKTLRKRFLTEVRKLRDAGDGDVNIQDVLDEQLESFREELVDYMHEQNTQLNDKMDKVP